MPLGRRAFLCSLGGALSALSVRAQTSRVPNVIVILADDLGYGDVGCFGSTVPTPNIDQMAAEGVRLTHFYSASPVCSPSRAALLTGRYPARTGIVNVLLSTATQGLTASERTIPKVLKQAGYASGCIGKWHLGSISECMPDRHGFDEYFGVPYSNDMSPLPLLRGSNVVDADPAQESLLERFTAEAVSFIGRHKDGPFFLYMAHTAPHIPLAPSERFKGKSAHGAYGDVVAELDWSVGQVLDALKTNGIDENTLVVFTSDNGPWYQGSAGNLRGRKGSTYEGGVCEPFVARFPGQIPPGITSGGVTSSMDLLPTLAALAGTPLPASWVDGIDIWPILNGQKAYIDREVLLFFDNYNIQCIRWGPWKLHLARYNTFPWTVDPPGGRVNLPLPQPELYNIDQDPSESWDRAQEKPEVVKEMKARLDRLLPTLPTQVRLTWQDTQSRHVAATPVGALPYPEN